MTRSTLTIVTPGFVFTYCAFITVMAMPPTSTGTFIYIYKEKKTPHYDETIPPLLECLSTF